MNFIEQLYLQLLVDCSVYSQISCPSIPLFLRVLGPYGKSLSSCVNSVCSALLNNYLSDILSCEFPIPFHHRYKIHPDLAILNPNARVDIPT